MSSSLKYRKQLYLSLLELSGVFVQNAEQVLSYSNAK